MGGGAEKLLLTPREAWERLGVSRNYLYGLLRDGTIAHFRMSGPKSPIRIPVQALDDYIAAELRKQSAGGAPVLQIRMERLATNIITHLREGSVNPATTTWAQYRQQFFEHFWACGYSIDYLTQLAHRGVEDFVLRHYNAEKTKGPPAG